jgi:hypothetical protein
VSGDARGWADYRITGTFSQIIAARISIMTIRIKLSILVGITGLLLAIPITWMCGACGVLAAPLAGGIAGFLCVRRENIRSSLERAQRGFIPGIIAGALVFLGQLLGEFIKLVSYEFLTRVAPIALSYAFDRNVPPIEPISEPYSGVLFISTCYGILDLLISLLAGAIGGLLASPSQSLISTKEKGIE